MKSFTIILILILLNSCSDQKRVQSKSYDLMLQSLLSHSVNEITVDSLQKVQEQVIMLDARSAEEYEVSHIKNARFVGYEDFNPVRIVNIDRDTPIVVYCAVGYRSEQIAERLVEMDFTNIANLYGGIFEWKNRGNAVVNTKHSTNEVHGYHSAWGIWLNKGKKVYGKNQ